MGMTVVERDFHRADSHPIDIVEILAERSDWDFDRIGEDRIAVSIEAQWRIYSLSLAWSDRDDMLRMLCTFELNPPEDRMDEFFRLLNLANDRVWGGGFTYWTEQRLAAFRHGLTLAGGAHATPQQIEDMVRTAVGLAERFYPAFQLVCRGGSSAAEAVETAIEDARGTA